jgi:hypothetical protein
MGLRVLEQHREKILLGRYEKACRAGADLRFYDAGLLFNSVGYGYRTTVFEGGSVRKMHEVEALGCYSHAARNFILESLVRQDNAQPAQSVAETVYMASVAASSAAMGERSKALLDIFSSLIRGEENSEGTRNGLHAIATKMLEEQRMQGISYV